MRAVQQETRRMWTVEIGWFVIQLEVHGNSLKGSSPLTHPYWIAALRACALSRASGTRLASLSCQTPSCLSKKEVYNDQLIIIYSFFAPVAPQFRFNHGGQSAFSQLIKLCVAVLTDPFLRMTRPPGCDNHDDKTKAAQPNIKTRTAHNR